MKTRGFKIIAGFFFIILVNGCVSETSRPIANDIIDREGVLSSKIAFHTVSLPAFMQKSFDGRDLRFEEILDDNSAYTRYRIYYMSGRMRISGIMNIPKGKGLYPLVVLNHGYIDPHIYTNGRGLKREQDYLARRGFAVIHPDYRNHAFSDKDERAELGLRLGYVEDVINAIYAVKNSGLESIDKNNILMLGHSMGGGIAINIMVTQPKLVDAYVLFAPVSADYKDNFDKWTKRRPEMAEKIIETYGDFDATPDFWKNISAFTFIDNVSAPILIHHGLSDDSVPIEWSEKFEQALKSRGKDVILHRYENEPHEFINAWPLVMKRTVEFFRSPSNDAINSD